MTEADKVWAESFGKSIAKQVAAIVDRDCSDKSRQVQEAVLHSFMTSFTRVVVAAQLVSATDDINGMTMEALFGFSIKGLSESNLSFQQSIAAGFQAAMTQFVGKDVEYYCQVRPVPEPISKTLQ